MEVVDDGWDGNVNADVMELPETDGSLKGLQLIPLPGGKSNVWKYYGMYSQDGVSILPQHSSRVYCMVPGCPFPEMVYCGNTTNLYGHLQRKHPEIELPEKRPVKPKYNMFKKPGVYPQKKSGRVKATAQRYARRIRRNSMIKTEEEPLGIESVMSDHRMYVEQDNHISHEQYSLSNALTVDLHEGPDDLVIVDQDNRSEIDFITPDRMITESKAETKNNGTQTGDSTPESPVPVPGLQKEHVTDALLDLMVSDLTGEQLVQRPGFQAFINTLYPCYDLPTVEQARNSLKVRYHYCKTVLRQVLDSVKHVSISVNQWTCKSDGKKNMIVSASYIDSNWTLNHRVLANIAADYCSEEQLRNVLADYSLLPDKVISITSNVLLGNVQTDVPQLPCFESALDEALQFGFEHGSVEQLHKLFLSSSVMSSHDNLHTKWTSVYQILDNIVRVSNDSDSAVTELHSMLGNILKLMNILDRATLSCASVAIPLTSQISSMYLNSGTSPEIRKMKREVGARLQNKFRDTTRLRLLEKCTFLDPRFKDADIFQNKSVLCKEILDEMNLQIEVSEIEFITEKKQVLLDLFKTLPKPPRTTEQKISSELDFYANCQSAGYDENPISWWKSHYIHFPTLSLLARKYLVVPLKTKRSTTSSFFSNKDAELLLFLNSNKDLTKKTQNDN